jgi:hypothetical protein
MSRTLQQHINDNLNELDNPNINSQRRRHIESELNSLEKYQANHPNQSHDPTSLELFCNEHPDASECRIYDN